MEPFFKTLAKILAVLFAILFVFTTPLAFAFYNVERSAFDAELYQQALEEENTYQRLPGMAAKFLANAAQHPGRNDLLAIFKNLSEDEWRVFLGQILPPAELKTIADNVVAQMMVYLNGESDNVVLPLSSLKMHLSSPEGINAIFVLLKTQPDCTLDQLAAMAMGQQSITLCNPPDTFMFIDLRPIIETQIKSSLLLVPEQVTIVSPNEARSQELKDLETLRVVMRLSPLVPVLCLLAIIILAVRSFRGWLAWWGYPLLFAGLLSMLLGGMSRLLATWFFRFAISPRLPQILPVEIVYLFSDLMAATIHNALKPVALQASFIALAGLLMGASVILLSVLKKRS